MEQELNIAAILKDKPKGTKLYDTARCVSVAYQWVDINSKIIHGLAENKYLIYERNGSLIGYPKGALILKPSKQMQDWSKFAWKKGDVLTNGNSTVIFERWLNDSYTKFCGVHEIYQSQTTKRYIESESEYNPYDYEKEVNNNKIKAHLCDIEYEAGGKLNMETLEIEKPQFKDGDIVAMDIQRSTNIAILKSTYTEDIVFYAMLCNGKDLFIFSLLDEPCKANNATLRLATDSEKQQLFDAIAKEGKRWNAETKTLEDLPKKCEFKPMDWCLMKDYGEKWKLCQFGFMEEEAAKYQAPYNAVGGNWFNECIPYNEQTKHLLGTTDDYEE